MFFALFWYVVVIRLGTHELAYENRQTFLKRAPCESLAAQLRANGEGAFCLTHEQITQRWYDEILVPPPPAPPLTYQAFTVQQESFSTLRECLLAAEAFPTLPSGEPNVCRPSRPQLP